MKEKSLYNNEPVHPGLVNIDKTKQKMTVSLDGVETYEWPLGWAEGD
jgi:hypothetical protein